MLYLADQAHIPYGPRQKAQIRDFSFGITDFCWPGCQADRGGLQHGLRQRAARPAGALPGCTLCGHGTGAQTCRAITKTGRVGVLATPTTFAGDLYHALVDRFAQGIEIYKAPARAWWSRLNAGQNWIQPATRAILEDALNPCWLPVWIRSCWAAPTTPL
jgi:glutamate racemase